METVGGTTAVATAEAGALALPLEDERALDRGRVGGKAATLARLARAGFPVPRAVALTTDAFRAFVRDNGLEQTIDASLRGASQRQGTRPGERVATHDVAQVAPSVDVRAAVEAGACSTALREVVLAMMRPLTGPFAVRSSATDEDGEGSSFAGQHATVLDVRGDDAVFAAVRTCFASLLSPSALDYRRARAGAGSAAMAVLVQELVPAETSGVAFTVDPVTGDGRAVVIEAVRGPGEALVSGAVTPEQLRIDRGSREIDRGGIEAVLTDAQAREVATLALRIEQELGAPQDVEWAMAGSRIWLLQSRPITGVDRDAPSELDTVTSPSTQWTSANVQEVLPGLLSPLTRSIVLRDFDAYVRVALARMGLRLSNREPLVGTFFGRAFLNLTLAQEIGGETATADKHYLGDEEERARRPAGGGALGKLRLLLAAPRTIRTLTTLDRAVAEGEAALAALPASPTYDEVSRAVHACGAAHVLVSIVGGGAFTVLGQLTARFLGDENGELHGRLLKGLADMESARPAFELFELARLAERSPALRDALERPEALAALDGDDARPFRTRLDAFLRDHGHHGVKEMELAAPAWEDEPAAVLSMARNYLDADIRSAPAAIEERARLDREAATEEAFDRLARWQRPLFRAVLDRARRYISLRERTKSLLVRAIHRRRRLVRAVARSLASRGLVAEHDVYALTWEEVTSLGDGRLSAEAAAVRIRRRRAEERRNRGIVLPDTFEGRPQPIRPEPPPAGADQLTGIPVSPGVVTGRARVILDPGHDARLLPGEILVAPITDAGWAPLFTVAAGLVVDVGGALSHGSTVAREYGLPAVVNVRVGTRVIRTGDMLTVDGTHGVVILQRATSSGAPGGGG